MRLSLCIYNNDACVSTTSCSDEIWNFRLFRGQVRQCFRHYRRKRKPQNNFHIDWVRSSRMNRMIVASDNSSVSAVVDSVADGDRSTQF